jgi:esterase/lipase
MRKIIFPNSKKLNLVGVLHSPKKESNSAIIISHGFTANKDRTRLIKLADNLSKIGFIVLRFDFSGCGESNFSEITIKNQIDDLKSAINYIKKKGIKNISLIGESLGSLISVLSYNKNIKTLVLLAPVTKSIVPSIIKNNEVKKELNKNGFIIYKKDNKDFKIPKEYFQERQRVNQKDILSKIKCPVLIIHGDQDNTIPLKHSESALKHLSKDSKLELIQNGDHQLNNKTDVVIPLIINWFRTVE